MKYIYILTTLSLFGCLHNNPIETYTATVKNESGVPIKVIGYYYSDKREEVTYLEKNQELTKMYKTYRPPTFDLKYFFTSTVKNGEVFSNNLTDSIKIIFNNSEKFKTFTSDLDDVRNPIGSKYIDKDIFIFIEEDYNNADDCNGNCE